MTKDIIHGWYLCAMNLQEHMVAGKATKNWIIHTYCRRQVHTADAGLINNNNR